MPFQDMASELQQLYTRTIPHLEGLEEDESIDAVRRGQSIMEAEEDSGLFEHDNTMDFMDEEMDMHEEVAAPLPDEGWCSTYFLSRCIILLLHFRIRS